MTVALLDVNVLIALAWPNHEHHDPAMAWFEEKQTSGWATCPLTQSGFVRISSNRAILPDARTPKEALDLLREIVALPHHVFWTDEVALADSPFVAGSALRGHRQVTDVHLLALAEQRSGRVATLDHAMANLLPPGRSPESLLALIPRT